MLYATRASEKDREIRACVERSVGRKAREITWRQL